MVIGDALKMRIMLGIEFSSTYFHDNGQWHISIYTTLRIILEKVSLHYPTQIQRLKDDTLLENIGTRVMGLLEHTYKTLRRKLLT